MRPGPLESRAAVRHLFALRLPTQLRNRIAVPQQDYGVSRSQFRPRRHRPLDRTVCAPDRNYEPAGGTPHLEFGQRGGDQWRVVRNRHLAEVQADLLQLIIEPVLDRIARQQ